MSHGELNSLEQPSAAGSGLTLELIAPATDEATLNALLATGVDAVCFRVEALNGRRRRDGFSYDRVPAVVGAVRSRGARAYLSFDLDVAERELEIAARVLELGVRHNARRFWCGIRAADDARRVSGTRVPFQRTDFHHEHGRCRRSGGVGRGACHACTRSGRC